MVSVEDKMETCRWLVNWSRNNSGSVRYMENRIYAVSVGYGVVTLIEASSDDEAYEKVVGFKRGEVRSPIGHKHEIIKMLRKDTECPYNACAKAYERALEYLRCGGDV